MEMMVTGPSRSTRTAIGFGHGRSPCKHYGGEVGIRRQASNRSFARNDEPLAPPSYEDGNLNLQLRSRQAPIRFEVALAGRVHDLGGSFGGGASPFQRPA